MSQFNIRPYHSSDLTMLYRICLETGDSGQDATSQYHDPDLLGHFYAAPYAVLEPELCFILTRDGAPCGYVLGTQDSVTFRERCELEWFPPLRQRYPLPDTADRSRDAAMTRLIHAGTESGTDFPEYPAHLHIDLLPTGQGEGRGRATLQTFLDKLRELQVPGVHLGVGAQNAKAIAFYERVGFQKLLEGENGKAYGAGGRAYGMKL
jgi:ribosomal protein S18 acetylase RimI-like enzyme